jgi:hypothetical protein
MNVDQFLGKITNDQLAKFSDGRSDSFFIFSPDKKFILKTISSKEASALLKMLPSLHHVGFSSYPFLLLLLFSLILTLPPPSPPSFLPPLHFFFFVVALQSAKVIVVFQSQSTLTHYTFLRMSCCTCLTR